MGKNENKKINKNEDLKNKNEPTVFTHSALYSAVQNFLMWRQVMTEDYTHHNNVIYLYLDSGPIRSVYLCNLFHLLSTPLQSILKLIILGYMQIVGSSENSFSRIFHKTGNRIFVISSNILSTKVKRKR